MCAATIPAVPWDVIAASAYRAFCAKLGGDLPTWDELALDTKEAWEAAARQVGDYQAKSWADLKPDEKHWAQWKPVEPGLKLRKSDSPSTLLELVRSANPQDIAEIRRLLKVPDDGPAMMPARVGPGDHDYGSSRETAAHDEAAALAALEQWAVEHPDEVQAVIAKSVPAAKDV